MLKNSVTTQEEEVPEQEQGSIVVSSGGAATLHSWRNIGLVVEREYKNRVMQRSFIISTIIILLFVVIGAFVPTIIRFFTSASNSQTKIVVVNSDGPVAGLDGDALAGYISSVLNGTAAQSSGTNTPGQSTAGTPQFVVTIQPAGGLNGLQNQVKNGHLNILLVVNRAANQDLRFTYYSSANATSDSNLPRIEALAQQLNFLDAARRLGLSATQISSLVAQPGFSVVNTGQNSNSLSVAGYIVAIAGNILIYMAVTIYGMSVATGAAEEKGSRIMEILVNAATPLQLMLGKVVGIGAAGLTQMALVVAIGIGALLVQNPLQAAIFGASSGGLNLASITSISVTLLLLLLVYFILGFLLYATLFAAMGALVKRQDEVQNAVMPITFLLLIGYLVSYFGVSTPNATWIRVISYIPFWTPTTMLTRVGAGGAAWWEIPLTVALMIVAIFVCAWISARIYRYGVLMYGQRPGLGKLIKIIRTE